ncbi:MAG: 50S ribosomal protein L35 [bacterium]
MPKIKTRKSVVKRFHQTSTGKLMHRHTSRAHSMVSKSPGRKRRLLSESSLHPGKNKVIHRQLPNGSNY